MAKTREAGFDCEFVDPPPTVIQTECPVCLLIIREPYQVTCCGKRFCQYCIKTASKPCPTCKAEIVHSFPDKGLKQSLYTLRVRCSYQKVGCEWTGELGKLNTHLNENPQPGDLEGCPHTTISCDFHHVSCTVKLPRKDMPDHLRESILKHMSLMVIGHSRLEAEFRTLKEDCVTLKRENEQLKNKVAVLQGSSAQATTKSVRAMIIIPPSDVLVMNNFQQQKRDGDWWYSPPIYTHDQGYKICLGVCACGHGNHTHVSAFVYFMRGEFDDSLTWPFRGAIRFQLLDQTGNNHKTHLCTYDDSVEMKNCERVRYGERANSGWGAPMLIAHSALKPHFLQRDTLWFQIAGGEAHV